MTEADVIRDLAHELEISTDYLAVQLKGVIHIRDARLRAEIIENVFVGFLSVCEKIYNNYVAKATVQHLRGGNEGEPRTPAGTAPGPPVA